MAGYAGQVDEIMTQLSAWLLGSGCRENPGKICFQTHLPSVYLERELLAEKSVVLPGDLNDWKSLELGPLRGLPGDFFSSMMIQEASWTWR